MALREIEGLSINSEPLGFSRGLKPFGTLTALSLSKGLSKAIPRALVLGSVEGSDRGVEWVDFLPEGGEMKIIDILKLAVSIILCQLAGFIGSIFTTPAIPTWYESLRKPFFSPPNWIFGPVWVSLYLLMGISLFVVWQRRENNLQAKKGLILFFAQLILNAFWSAAFFGLKSPFLGLINIILLWAAIFLTIQHFLKISKTAAVLLLPYILWVSFAAVLNFSLWILNM